jgi:ABC-type multidrug transport system fused ATPase/permease subunit
VAHESFDGALVVKALQAEEAEGRRFADKAELLRDARIEAARVTANFEASLDALPALTTVALLVIGVWRIEQGAITAGTLVGLINLFALLIWPLRLIGYVLGDMPRAVAGYERVAAVLTEPLPPPTPGQAEEPLPEGPLDLEVEGLGYGYEPGAEVLDEVSFRVPAGGTVALVGPTGSGKSTLALLLARLLPPGRGRIRLGGRDLAGLGGGEVAGSVAIAFQEPFLFSTSVRDNIHLERGGDGVGDAARLAQAEEFVARLPEGYDTVVGERVLYLEDGRLVADGPHERLLATTPGYARLVRAYEAAEAEVKDQ